MPYKDKRKRYEAVLKSRAKKPELYAALDRKKGQSQARRGYILKRNYGITWNDFNALVEKQNGVCAICNKPPAGGVKSKRLHVDHNHDTKKVRGLLCFGCNSFVGKLEHNQELLQKALAYIEENN